MIKTSEITDFKDTRSGFGDALAELGKLHNNVVALCADLTGSLKMDNFKNKFPERFFQIGIAEANMICIASGLATSGYVPFTGTFANFSTGRVYDQIRQSVAYSNKNVKICASHAGLTLGEDGATHQILEDIGLMKMLPNMTVINPCDYNQTKIATKEIYSHQGPVYLRFGRPKIANFTSLDEKFEIGKAIVLKEGKDVSIFATGHLVWESLIAAEKLKLENIDAEVINIHTIKPIDKDAIIKSAKKTKCIITAEEHFYNGGLGDSISQLLSKEYPVLIDMVGVDDVFGESGTPEELMKKYGLHNENIINKVKNIINKKTL